MNSRVLELKKQASSIRNYSGSDERLLKSPYQNMDGRMAALQYVVDQNINPIQFDIQNTDNTVRLVCPLFGVSSDYVIPFNGTSDMLGTASTAGKGIIVTPVNRTLKQIALMAQNTPFTTARLRYIYGDNLQLSNNFIIKKTQDTARFEDVFSPALYQPIAQNLQGVVETDAFNQYVNQDFTLGIPVEKATSASSPRAISVVLFIGVRTDLSQTLQGQSPLTANKTSVN